ncbi:hypothetical protein N7509_005226 [Penicillium cosmopolitanum]|uniref:GDP/GTP exchange factor Sec2 N-terminal domain-containing protein n=1 Tax=Penicillium cosmopolitanum TaxID=1131564 RepID=A0A9X0B9V8_9EURO|nr:uncharacterized protein N7509_005226 [Penicillium cosmopolitanum]KAJ5397113.1 hypothetical protein N7509_005226 [Penicillium cosmopolitanum]
MIPRHAHKRSLSSEHRILSPEKTVTKAKSTTDLSQVASQADAHQSRPSFEENNFSTLQDPRLHVDREVSPSTSSSHHPDLSNEVAALSVKLIQAINNQTTLDDSLGATRQELEVAQGKIIALEFQNEKYHRDLDQKVYIKKADSDREIQQLKAVLAEERAQRAIAEKGKKTMEQELETLTADLFEEANKMVAAAKIEREAVEKKNEQLRSQIKDTESLLASHQEQMAELKSVLQGMHLNKEDLESRTNISTAPPSPGGAPQLQGFAKQDSEMGTEPPMLNPEEFAPGPSCNFPDMIRMVCRADLPAYDDFRDLLVLSRTSKPPSRAGSGSYGGLNVMSLASFATGGSNSATSSPTKGFGHSPNGSLSSQTGSHIPLKDTKFYKRVLMEDIEPTLRLDLSPGISWLTRRTVLSGICEGSLVVEPVPAATKQYEFPCSVCGERRTGENNERTHRFRTSESETAQRYSLCIQCLERVRSCCEFTGYLRMILDGHIRAGDSEEEKDVWEETVRLRERMFWSRVAGGIVPLYTKPADAEVPQPDLPSDSATPQDYEDDEPFVARDITVQSHDGVGIPTTKLSVPEYDMSRPVTPDLPTLNIHDENSSPEARRRGSIDSDISVYEEANAEVVYVPQTQHQPEAQAESQVDAHESSNEPAVESQPELQEESQLPTAPQPEVTITPDSPADHTTEPQSEAQAESQVDTHESSNEPAVESQPPTAPQPEVTVTPDSPTEPAAKPESETQAESQAAIHDSQEHHESHETPAGEEGTEVDGSKHTSTSA